MRIVIIKWRTKLYSMASSFVTLRDMKIDETHRLKYCEKLSTWFNHCSFEVGKPLMGKHMSGNIGIIIDSIIIYKYIITITHSDLKLNK